MSKIIWGAPGTRQFESGLDRGVFYPLGGVGVPWNGLISVNESTDSGKDSPYYLDGIKVLNLAGGDEFAADIEAFSAPKELHAATGVTSIGSGLFATQQPRKSFDLSYRTLLGDDLNALGTLGYKIHLVYNALASPSDVDNTTVADDAEPSTQSWAITTKAVRNPGLRPTAHFVVNTIGANPYAVEALEAALYGSDYYNPYMPSVSELIAMFS